MSDHLDALNVESTLKITGNLELYVGAQIGIDLFL